MADYIDRQAAIEVADAVWSVTGDVNVAKVWDQLRNLPSADAVEVVKCRDCRYFNSTFPLLHMCDISWMKMKPDEYCSLGERKEQ